MATFKRIHIFTGILLLIMFSCKKKEEKEQKVPAKIVANAPGTILAIGRIEPLDKIITLYPEVSGVIKELNISLGDTVKKGAILAVLENAEESAALESARAQLSLQSSTIESIQAELGRASANVSYWEDQYNRFNEAFRKNAATKQELTNAETNLNLSRAEVQKQKALLEGAKGKTRELTAQENLNNARLGNKIIKAPSDGVILSLDVARGTLIGPATAIGQFATLSPTIALCEVDELYAGKIKTGQPAIIRMQGAGDTLATGKVIAAAPFLRQKSLFSDEIGNLEDRRVREVKVEITRGKENVLLGMRVETIINLK